MKNLFITMIFALICTTASAEEISLFNSNGEPIAYIDVSDDDLTIYMWNGTPVAYLTAANKGYNIYGFNGKHLGWFDGGLVINHEGYTVGFQKGSVNKHTKYEPYKSYKKPKPYKNYKQNAPYKPYAKNRYSTETLSLFLLRGKK